MEENLLIPITCGTFAAMDGGRKTNNAGSWMSPPPPAIESTNPAKNAATDRIKTVVIPLTSRAQSLLCGAIYRMFTRFAKSIQLFLGLRAIIVSTFAADATAKGGSLGVRTNDGRKHFTLTADATW